MTFLLNLFWFGAGGGGTSGGAELREDGSNELREDGSIELRE